MILCFRKTHRRLLLVHSLPRVSCEPLESPEDCQRSCVSLNKMQFLPLLSRSHSELHPDSLWRGMADGYVPPAGTAEQAWTCIEGSNLECSSAEWKEDKSHGKLWWEVFWKRGKSRPLLVRFNSPKCNLKGAQQI